MAASHSPQQQLPKNNISLPIALADAAMAFLLITASCGQLPPTNSVVIPPIPAGDARIWFYRDGGPRDAERPYFRLNGQIAGISEPNGTLYRDVLPGHYKVTVDSYTISFFDQFANINLVAGQEAYILVWSRRQSVGGETGSRENFFTQAVPADIARLTTARLPFYGGS
jgi:hypothetical protein